MPHEIVVTKRTSDYHAHLKNHRAIWGCGNNPKEAIGNLITAHYKEFDIEVVYDYPTAKADPYLKAQGVEIIGGRK